MSEAAATAETSNDAGANTPADGGATTALTGGASTQDASNQQTQQQDGGAADGAKGSEDGQKADGKPEGDKSEGAPEAYTDFTTPEDVKLDPELAGELKTLAKELNLPQAQAQKVADLGAKLAQKMVADQAETLKQARTQWESEARADKEIGGDAFEANLGVAKKAVDAFVSPELKAMLNETGLGNHPELIRTFVKIGKAIKEDGFVGGRATPAVRGDMAQRLYGNKSK